MNRAIFLVFAAFAILVFLSSSVFAAVDPYPIPSNTPAVTPREMTFHTVDGETIAADFYHADQADQAELANPSDPSAGNTLIILGPGFAQNKGTPLMHSLSTALSRHGDTLCLDFRGTGKSSGLYDFGATGHLDFEPVLRQFRHDYSRVVLMGLSLGAYSALVAAADYPELVDHTLAVSAPTSVDDIVWGGSLWENAVYALAHPGLPENYTGADWLFRWGYPFMKKPNTKDLAPLIGRPVDFLVGTEDRLVPAKMSRSIYDQVSAARTWTSIQGGHHAESMYLVLPDSFMQWVSQSLSTP